MPGTRFRGRATRVEREDGGRVLLTYDVDGETKVAFVAAADVGNYAGDRGWHELTFLYLGGAERGAVFVRDRDGEFESELMRIRRLLLCRHQGGSTVSAGQPSRRCSSSTQRRALRLKDHEVTHTTPMVSTSAPGT